MQKAHGRNQKKGWDCLVPGDVVDVVAPASQCSWQELEAGVKVLESWGLQVRYSPQIFAKNLLHSNSDEERARQLKKALWAKDSKAVWCVRGGYGSMKLLPFLDQFSQPSRTKIFLGLSDIGSLQTYLTQKWKWPVLHAPILSRIGRGDLPEVTVFELKQVLFGNVESLDYELNPLNKAAEKVKTLSGNLLGGNWTTLMANIATPFAIKPKGTLLFLEEVNERAYRLDRYWEQMLQMGFMNSIEGLILGDFTGGDEPDGKNLIWDILKERSLQLMKPVYFGVPSGHGSIQRVLPLGVKVKIQFKNHQWIGSTPTGVKR